MTQQESAVAFIEAHEALGKARFELSKAQLAVDSSKAGVERTMKALNEASGNARFGAAIEHAQAVRRWRDAEKESKSAGDTMSASIKRAEQLFEDLIATCQPSG